MLTLKQLLQRHFDNEFTALKNQAVAVALHKSQKIPSYATDVTTSNKRKNGLTQRPRSTANATKGKKVQLNDPPYYHNHIACNASIYEALHHM